MSGILAIQNILPQTGLSTTAETTYKFTVQTRQDRDPGVETPVSAERDVLAVRRRDGEVDLYTIGSEGRLHRFRREGKGWRQQSLGFRADSLAAVPQRDGSDKVFFGEVGEHSLLVSVYELERKREKISRRAVGRLATSDSKVCGISSLCGAQDAAGGNILLTSLRARPQTLQSNIVLVFGKGVGTGALSGNRPVAATKVEVCGSEPGSIHWPHLTFVALFDGELRAEWGSQKGAILQTQNLKLPPLKGVVDFTAVRDSSGDHLFALDTEHRLFHLVQMEDSLAQVDGAAAQPPVWADAWEQIEIDTFAVGEPLTLHNLQVHYLASANRLQLIASDTKDRLWSLRQDLGGDWQAPRSLGVEAASWTTTLSDDGVLEVFAVSRSKRLTHLSWKPSSRKWNTEEIPWRASASERRHDRYGALVKAMHESGVAGNVPVRVSATEHLIARVNGLPTTLAPGADIEARTDSQGRVEVSFETFADAAVPSVNFESEFLGEGTLAVCPSRNVQLYVKKGYEQRAHDSSVPDIYLIPEQTEVWQP